MNKLRKFDTKVQYLKYKVLREVARQAWNDTLLENVLDIPKIIVPGKTPTMRCCVYKERAPMYDVNPNPDGVGLSLNIDDMDNSLNFDVAIDVAKYFEIKKDEAAKIADDIKQNIRQWESVAEKVGISRSNMMRLENCFKF